MLRKLLSHAAIYGVAQQVPRLAGVLTLPVITRFLSSTDYGVAGVVTAYVAAFTMLQSLGLGTVMVNSFARHPTRYSWIWRQLNGFMSLWSLGYGLLVGVTLYFVVPPEANEHRLEIALLYSLPLMFFTSAESQYYLYYQLSQRPLPIAVRSFIVGVTTVALNISFIAYFRLGYMGWFYSNFIASLVGFIFSVYSIYIKQQLWPIFDFKWKRIKSALRVSLPIVPHQLAYYLLDTSDRLVLDVLGVPLPRIGLYNVASSFGGYFMVATGAIMQAASPFYMRYHVQEGSIESAYQARRLTFLLQLLFLLMTSLGALWMKEIFEILIRNEALQQAYPIAIIVLMGYNFRPLYVAATNLLVYQEKTNQLWKISVVAGVGNVILNLILVPLYGFEVAAITTFAALMYMGCAGFFLKEYKRLALVKHYPLLWLLLTVAALAVVYQLAAIGIVMKVIITAAVAVVSAVAVMLFWKTFEE